MVGLKIYITYFFYLITVQEDSITKNRMDRAAFFHLFINLLFIFNKKEMRYVYHIWTNYRNLHVNSC